MRGKNPGIGSQQGNKEASFLPCPAQMEDVHRWGRAGGVRGRGVRSASCLRQEAAKPQTALCNRQQNPPSLRSELTVPCGRHATLHRNNQFSKWRFHGGVCPLGRQDLFGENTSPFIHTVLGVVQAATKSKAWPLLWKDLWPFRETVSPLNCHSKQ
jgi:hypothetical protein